MTYARQTSVPVDRSRNEIERTLERYGADQFAYLRDAGGAVIAFRMSGRQVRFLMPMPDIEEFRWTPQSRRRTESAAQQAFEQAVRARWRALLLIVKAKLEAVEAGISTFEKEFLSDILLGTGQTVHEWLSPQLDEHYKGGDLPGGIMAALPRGST